MNIERDPRPLPSTLSYYLIARTKFSSPNREDMPTKRVRLSSVTCG